MIKVSWDPPPLQLGAEVTGFLVEVKEDVSDVWMNYSKPAHSQECTITGLKAERNYTVRVLTKNTWGYGNSTPKTIRTDPTGT